MNYMLTNRTNYVEVLTTYFLTFLSPLTHFFLIYVKG